MQITALQVSDLRQFNYYNTSSVKDVYSRQQDKTKYKICIESLFSLTWQQNKEVLKAEKRLDGVFPLLTTDKELLAKQVLLAYKYQP